MGIWGPVIGAVAGSAASGLINKLLEGGGSTVSQGPLQTSEQSAARQLLLKLANSGQFGDITLGEDIGLPSSNFSLSDMERTGINAIRDRFESGNPTQLTQTLNALSSFLEDPTIDPAGQFAPFKSRVERELQDRSDAFKRNAAITGNLFSTDLQRNMADIQREGQNTLSSELARLTDQAINRRFEAAQSAPTIVGLINELEKGRINDMITAGGIERSLSNQATAEQRSELLRRRDEELQRINALNSILGSNTQFGVPSITIPQTSPFQGVSDLTGQIIGNSLTNYLNSRNTSSSASSGNSTQINAPFGQTRLDTGNRLSLF